MYFTKVLTNRAEFHGETRIHAESDYHSSVQTLLSRLVPKPEIKQFFPLASLGVKCVFFFVSREEQITSD